MMEKLKIYLIKLIGNSLKVDTVVNKEVLQHKLFVLESELKDVKRLNNKLSKRVLSVLQRVKSLKRELVHYEEKNT